MNIIFICRHNVFRSRVAEFYFKKYNKNKNIKAISGGLIKGIKNNKGQIEAFKDLNINPNKFTKPKNISVDILRKQDLIIIAADDVPIELFNNKSYVKKVIKWNIKDVTYDNKLHSIESINLIEKKVKNLIKSI
ncbi:MAG: hypothetical protein WC867_04400 [Candidatus Pacearchaeota archaeon]|jgi:protein-tyrosine-phosphatase